MFTGITEILWIVFLAFYRGLSRPRDILLSDPGKYRVICQRCPNAGPASQTQDQHCMGKRWGKHNRFGQFVHSFVYFLHFDPTFLFIFELNNSFTRFLGEWRLPLFLFLLVHLRDIPACLPTFERVGHSLGFGLPFVAILPWLCTKRRKAIFTHLPTFEKTKG